MKKAIQTLFITFLSLSFYQCETRNQSQGALIGINEKEEAKIKAENKEAWEKIKDLRFTDSDFLQTKEPMSDNAIAPHDYHTGLVGNRAYNQRVYLLAIERVRQHLSVENNQLKVNLKSGAEINVAEDLFEYIRDILIKDWNKWVKEGTYEIIKNDNGYYDILFVEKNNMP